MTSGRFAILDPAAGMSGDMLLGALVDAGAPARWIQELPARLGFPEVEVEVARVLRCGVSCTKVTVKLAGATERPGLEYAAPHRHGPETDRRHPHRHGPGGHRHLDDLLEIVARAPVSPGVKDRATRALRLLCEAEGATHGVPAAEVALHEVGAVDAIVDIVGACEGVELLGLDRVYTRPVALGTGWVQTAHGVMPVPAPVTARLLEGLEIGPNGPVTGEAVTPTGAVLLRTLTAGAPPARWRQRRTGWGAGGRDPEHYPNALRLLLAEPAQEAGQVVTLSTDLDDLDPEYLEPLREALHAAGALDVQIWPTHMKKGRLGLRLEALADPATADRVTEALFLHSTTAGVRRTPAERVTLPRRLIEVETPGGHRVRVKVVETPAGPRLKPEFDDVSAVARATGRPALDIAREAEWSARTLIHHPAQEHE
ncbi:MAG TPA: nickel pincer cofactor biosynthesis protein LarC [Gemmatimonadales bacterium]|nr:nickel pincer cofactor biosynthesis protein LarC [Gemmatimonadales bacterium]